MFCPYCGRDGAIAYNATIESVLSAMYTCRHCNHSFSITDDSMMIYQIDVKTNTGDTLAVIVTGEFSQQEATRRAVKRVEKITGKAADVVSAVPVTENVFVSYTHHAKDG